MRYALFILTLFFTLPLSARICLDYVMTPEQMHITGIDELDDEQRYALELWLNDYFELKKPKEGLYITMNFDSGAKINLSDDTAYEIDPEDRVYAAFWMTPFPVKLGKSSKPQYPVKITNMYTGTSIKAKRISPRELLEEERPKHSIEKPKQEPPNETP